MSWEFHNYVDMAGSRCECELLTLINPSSEQEQITL